MLGWKTKVGGAIFIVVGVGGYILTLLGYDGISFEVASGFTATGFGMLGVGHKLDRLLLVLKDLPPQEVKK